MLHIPHSASVAAMANVVLNSISAGHQSLSAPRQRHHAALNVNRYTVFYVVIGVCMCACVSHPAVLPPVHFELVVLHPLM